MPVETVDLLMGRTSQQTHLDRIELCQIVLFEFLVCHHFANSHNCQESEAESPKNVIFLFHDAKILYILQ